MPARVPETVAPPGRSPGSERMQVSRGSSTSRRNRDSAEPEPGDEEMRPADGLEQRLPCRGREAEPLPGGLEVVVTVEGMGRARITRPEC